MCTRQLIDVELCNMNLSVGAEWWRESKYGNGIGGKKNVPYGEREPKVSPAR